MDTFFPLGDNLDSYVPLGVLERTETLEQAVRLFSVEGMPAQKLSALTRKSYRHDLADFMQFLTDRGVTKIVDVSLRHLEAYQAEMDRRDYAASTCNRKTHSIKSLFHFLHRHGITQTNLAAQLIPPSVPKHDPRFLSEAEYQRLLRECSHKPRDATIIELFLQTGMRLSELARLQLHDVEIPKRITPDPDNMGYVRVRRKGGKVETIPLNHKACKAIASWLLVRPEIGETALFLSQFKRQMSTRAIQHRMTKYVTEAFIPSFTRRFAPDARVSVPCVAACRERSSARRARALRARPAG